MRHLHVLRGTAGDLDSDIPCGRGRRCRELCWHRQHVHARSAGIPGDVGRRVAGDGNDFGNHQQPPPTPVRGKTQGFWHNQNGHAILDTNNDGNLDTPVDIGGATHGFHVTTIAQSDKILPPNNACGAGAPVIFAPCTLSDSLNLQTLNVLAGQTLAVTYNIGKIPGYSGQTMSTLGCAPKVTAPLVALGLSASSTVNQVLTVANSLINNSTASGATTQAQAGAMNSLLGDCVNKE